MGETFSPRRILVICSGNSCRSQMAEAWFGYLAPSGIKAFSGGIEPAGFVHPLAVKAMAEAGIDLRHNHSKSIDQFLGQKFDTVITVCGEAEEVCPTFPGEGEHLHWPFKDPAKAQGTEAEKLAVFRQVRDQIKVQVTEYLRQNGFTEPGG